MFENKQERTSYVSLEEYQGSKMWRATTEELSESFATNDDQARGHFTMRLLERNRLAAHDQLVELVAADSVNNDGLHGPLVLTVRPILRGDQKARLQTHHISADGMVVSHNTPDFEDGYFVGGEGIGEDELQNFSMQLLVSRENVVVKGI